MCVTMPVAGMRVARSRKPARYLVNLRSLLRDFAVGCLSSFAEFLDRLLDDRPKLREVDPLADHRAVGPCLVLGGELFIARLIILLQL